VPWSIPSALAPLSPLKGVVELAEVFDGLDDPADLVVGVREVRPVDVSLSGEELLLNKTE
jgi:hypothetical protein